MKDLNDVSGEIVDAAVRLHTKLGPGLFESVYETLLAHELEKRGLKVERQKPVPSARQTASDLLAAARLSAGAC